MHLLFSSFYVTTRITQCSTEVLVFLGQYSQWTETQIWVGMKQMRPEVCHVPAMQLWFHQTVLPSRKPTATTSAHLFKAGSGRQWAGGRMADGCMQDWSSLFTVKSESWPVPRLIASERCCKSSKESGRVRPHYPSLSRFARLTPQLSVRM